MSTTEAARHQLYEEARRVMSDEAADTMMALLPPTGWGDVARTTDLERLREQIDHRFEQIDHRFEQLAEQLDYRFEIVENRLTGEFHKELLRTVVAANVATALSVGSLVLAAVRFA